jgi:hypothetical protein
LWWAFCRMMVTTLAVLYTQAMQSIQYALDEARDRQAGQARP